jgi:Family of unknown function (DUF6629)
VCFSPQADVAGGALICATGVDAVRHIRQRREFIALAWIPVLPGARQFTEAFVRLWLQGHMPRGIGQVALRAYLLIAFAVLPVFIPLAVIAVEPTRRRKQMMAPFALLGAVIAVTLLAAMARGPGCRGRRRARPHPARPPHRRLPTPTAVAGRQPAIRLILLE